MSDVSVRIGADASELRGAMSRDLEDLRRRLAGLANAGKDFSKLDFSGSTERLARELEIVQRRWAEILKLHPTFGQRLTATGQGGAAPWEIDFSRLYLDRSTAAARQQHILRQLTAGTRWEQQSPSPGGGAPPAGPAAPGGPGLPAFAANMGTAWGYVKAGAMMGASIYGIQGVIGTAMAGMRMAKDASQGFDTMARRLKESNQGFFDVQTGMRRFAGELKLTDDELGQFGRAWMETSRDPRLAETVAGVRTGVGFARGFGMEPSEGAAYFSRARSLGLFSDTQGTQRFALLLGRTISDGMMTGRPGDAFDSIIQLAQQSAGSRMSGLTESEQAAAMNLRAATAATGLPGAMGGLYDSIIARANAAIQSPGGGQGGQFFMQRALMSAGFGRGEGGRFDPFSLVAASQTSNLFSAARPGGTTVIEALFRTADKEMGGYNRQAQNVMLSSVLGLRSHDQVALLRDHMDAIRRSTPGADVSKYLGGVDLTTARPDAIKDIFETIRLAESGQGGDLRTKAQRYLQAGGPALAESAGGQAVQKALAGGSDKDLATAMVQLMADRGRERTPEDERLQTEKDIKEVIAKIGADTLQVLNGMMRFFESDLAPPLKILGEVLGVTKNGDVTSMTDAWRQNAAPEQIAAWKKVKAGAQEELAKIDAEEAAYVPGPGANTQIGKEREARIKEKREERRKALRDSIQRADTTITGLQADADRSMTERGTALARYYQRRLNLEPYQASALAGNAMHESSLNPTASGDHGTAFGIHQWRGIRQTRLRAFAEKTGRSADDPAVQAEFAAHELETHESAALRELRQTTDPVSASRAVNDRYERSADKLGGDADLNRIRHTRNVLKRLGATPPPTETAQDFLAKHPAAVPTRTTTDRMKAASAAVAKPPAPADAGSPPVEPAAHTDAATRFTPASAPGMPPPPKPAAEKPQPIEGSVDVTVTHQDTDMRIKSQSQHRLRMSSGRTSGGNNSVSDTYSHTRAS